MIWPNRALEVEVVCFVDYGDGARLSPEAVCDAAHLDDTLTSVLKVNDRRLNLQRAKPLGVHQGPNWH